MLEFFYRKYLFSGGRMRSVFGGRFERYTHKWDACVHYIDDIEYLEEPVPLILNEIELSSRPSLYKNLECNF